MLKLSPNKISLAASALLLCAGFAQAQTTEPVSPAVASTTLVNLQYTLPSTPGSSVTVNVTDIGAATGTYNYSLDPSTVPVWLTATPSGTIQAASSSSPATIAFVASSAAGTLTPGVYNATVHVRITGFQDLVIPVNLAVAGSASTLSITSSGTAETNGATISIPWVYGAAAPTLPLTLLSSDAPLAFSVATATTVPANTVDWIQSPISSGIAYNYGSTVTLTFLTDVLTNANVADVLQGTVTITPASGSAITLHIAITVGEPNPTVTSISPAYAPPSTTTALQVVVTGTGFTSSTATCAPATCGTKTSVMIDYAGDGGAQSLIAAQVGGSINVVSSTTMILTIPANDTQMSSVNILAAGSITLTISNASAAPAQTLHITTAPIINAITDAGALIAPVAGATPSFAPYEMVTIFGTNFGATAAVVGSPSGGLYPTHLTVAGGSLSVAVLQQDGTTLIADAPLLFASSNQINLMVPAEIIGTGITGLNFQVFLASTGGNKFVANPVAANPGIFTETSSGTGQGAILNADLTVNSDSNQATPGKTVVLYVTGLGAPNSTAADTAGKSAAKWPTSCISSTSYGTAATLSSLDGAVLDPTHIAANTLPPCFASGYVGVTIGGAPATITYAGWVSGSITSLYQINATVPTKAASGDLPVVVTATVGKTVYTSQTGATVAVN
jgi:uncharacterized protein (TIGR03437 family)